MDVQQDFALTCRFCIRCASTNTLETLQLQSIHDSPSGSIGDLSIAEILTTTTPWLTISHTDGLPQVTCKSCVDKIIEVKKFQNMCAISEQTLRCLSTNAAAAASGTYTPTPTIVKEEINIKEETIWPEVEFALKETTDQQNFSGNVNEEQMNIIDDTDQLHMSIDEEQAYDMKINKSLYTNKSYKCDECGKRLSTATSLTEHKLRHIGQSYLCPTCPKVFPNKTYLANHILMHSENKNYVCEICQSSFKRPLHLKVHKEQHLKGKPYKCNQCLKSFVEKKSLQIHMRTHSGEKPYKCQYCDWSGIVRGNLMLHLRKHLGNEIFNCDLCCCGFPTATELRLHYPGHKNDDVATRETNIAARQAKDLKLKRFFNMSPMTLDL